MAEEKVMFRVQLTKAEKREFGATVEALGEVTASRLARRMLLLALRLNASGSMSRVYRLAKTLGCSPDDVLEGIIAQWSAGREASEDVSGTVEIFTGVRRSETGRVGGSDLYECFYQEALVRERRRQREIEAAVAFGRVAEDSVEDVKSPLHAAAEARQNEHTKRERIMTPQEVLAKFSKK